MDCFLEFMHRWTAVWEFLTAIGTIALAFATFAVIQQGQKTREDGQAQHRERLRPVCSLVPYKGADTAARGDLVIVQQLGGNPIGTVKIRCFLCNVGVGPAVNVQISFRFLDMAGWTSPPWEMAPLQAGEKRGDDRSFLEVPFRLWNDFNAADYDQIPGKGWEIILDYEDMFGARYRTVHHKSPVFGPQNNLQPQPWATFERVE